MVVALDLHYGFEAEPYTPSSSDVALWGYDRRDEMITALEISTEFSRISKNESVEAENAYGILSFAVAKARKAQQIILGETLRGDSSTTGLTSNSDTTAPISGLGTEIFDGPLPDFDWVRDIISRVECSSVLTECRIFGISSITMRISKLLNSGKTSLPIQCLVLGILFNKPPVTLQT
jgi:hypothetical protein